MNDSTGPGPLTSRSNSSLTHISNRTGPARSTRSPSGVYRHALLKTSSPVKQPTEEKAPVPAATITHSHPVSADEVTSHSQRPPSSLSRALTPTENDIRQTEPGTVYPTEADHEEVAKDEGSPPVEDHSRFRT